MTHHERALIRPAIVIVLWVMYAVISVNQSILWNELNSRQREWYTPVGFAVTIAVTWCAFTPLIIALARRFPLVREEWLRSLMVHVPASLGLSLLDVLIDRPIGHQLGFSNMPSFWGDYLFQLDMNTFYYAVIVASVTTADFHFMYRERQRKATQLQTELVTSRLEVLKMQLQPHFLFNTLHSINTLIHEDTDAADRMVTRLADLLRLTLHQGDHEVPLARELELIHAYIEIQQIRFGDRLSFQLDISDCVLDAKVPSLLLQPLVENAIRHGIAPRGSGGVIQISASHIAERLHIDISDDGMGLQPNSNGGHGIGLANTRARLEQLYGQDQEFTIVPRPGGGAIVQIRIPYVEALSPHDLVALVV